MMNNHFRQVKKLCFFLQESKEGFSFFLERGNIQKIKMFDNISVREKTLKDYIEKISNKKAEVVLDPTFLLSEEDWLKIANSKIVPSKKYIFCYFLVKL